ncbi:hypothetical protein C6382_18700 [Pseudomonas sp. BBP2017]|nr:hypothetical protein C6382_18700 [Pseudomonas sp. BBP2017]
MRKFLKAICLQIFRSFSFEAPHLPTAPLLQLDLILSFSAGLGIDHRQVWKTTAPAHARSLKAIGS